MAYTLLTAYGEPKPIRLLSARGSFKDESYTIEVHESFTPHWWSCDPCNPSQSRYTVTFREDLEPQGFPWYAVVTTDDTEDDIAAKVAHYSRVLEAKQAADKAHREWMRLNGF